MVITLLGDLKHGRTVHSLAKLLSCFEGIHIQYFSPTSLSMPDSLIQELSNSVSKMKQTVLTCNLEEAIASSDVVYVTRIQKERFKDIQNYNNVMGSYCIDTKVMKYAKDDMIIMHPLPRVGEIHEDVDKDPRAAYFRQMENGMYMRMAILDRIFNG
jgi:aspartate carbamoyltransferase catalytic subunit